MSLPLTCLLLVISFTAQVHLFSDEFSDSFPDSFAGWSSKQFQCVFQLSQSPFGLLHSLNPLYGNGFQVTISSPSNLILIGLLKEITYTCPVLGVWWNQESKLRNKILVTDEKQINKQLVSLRTTMVRSLKVEGCHLLMITENVASRHTYTLWGFPVYPIMEKKSLLFFSFLFLLLSFLVLCLHKPNLGISECLTVP